ncbi:MAG: hypothetical protein ACJA1A_003643 [Saprospiraceae bacterium]|jgi:hypothetical protein
MSNISKIELKILLLSIFNIHEGEELSSEFL